MDDCRLGKTVNTRKRDVQADQVWAMRDKGVYRAFRETELAKFEVFHVGKGHVGFLCESRKELCKGSVGLDRAKVGIGDTIGVELH